MVKISCIIPAYNEAPRIKGILTTIALHPLVTEVIVVDDKSKDNTIDVVREVMALHPKIRLIAKGKNEGKSLAMRDGIKQSIGDYIMFIDSDLIGVTEENVTNLIQPVMSGYADVAISIRGNVPGLWKKIGLDYISGERVMPRSFLLAIADGFATIPRFGLESYMNKWMIINKFRIKIVEWPNVKGPYKYEKDGWPKAFKEDAMMMMDIFRTITVIGPIYQIIKIKKQQVR